MVDSPVPAVRPASREDSFRGARKVQLQFIFANTHIVNAERIPVGGQMRSKGNSSRLGIGCKAKHAAEQRANHHGRGPDLVRRTSGKRLVVIAGENFGHMAERAIQRKQNVGSKIVVGRLRTMVAILADAGPAVNSGQTEP